MRRLRWMVLVAVLAAPTTGRASILGEENAFLAQLVGMQLEELTQITTLITNVRFMLKGVNEVAGVARAAYRIYDMIRNYSVEDLIRDATTGLKMAFPELEGLEDEVLSLKSNIEAAHEGRFWGHRTTHDSQMDNLLRSAFRQAYRSTFYPAVFPKAEGVEPSEVDLLVQSRLTRSGMLTRTLMQDTALGILQQKAAAVVHDAELKGRTELQAGALDAQASVQTAANTQRLRDLADLATAEREAEDKAIEEAQKAEKAARKALAENSAALTTLGTIR